MPGVLSPVDSISSPLERGLSTGSEHVVFPPKISPTPDYSQLRGSVCWVGLFGNSFSCKRAPSNRGTSLISVVPITSFGHA